MKPPARWKESDTADGLAQALLRAARPTQPLSTSHRLRGARHAASLALLPLLGVTIWSKSVAAAFGVGVAGALTLVSVSPGLRHWLGGTAAVESPAARTPASRPSPNGGPRASVNPGSRSDRAPSDATPPATRAPSDATSSAPGAAPRIEGARRRRDATRSASRTPETRIDSAPLAPSIPATEPGISAELELVAAARKLLFTDAARALAILDQHRARFPAGALAMEREILSVDALSRSGQRALAIQKARELGEDPRNAFYASRLKRLLATLLEAR